MKQGNADALAVLMERYQIRGLRAANLITRDEAVAKDVVQSVFIRLYERRHLIDTSRPFGPYLMRSIVNEAINVANRAKRYVTYEDEIADENALAQAFVHRDWSDPQQALDDSERRQMIADALAELTPKQRAVIVMRYFLDMTETEIAIANNEPNGTVRWRLHAARNRLRGILNWGKA